MLNNNSQNPNSFSPDCLVTCSVDGNIIDVARSLCELCRPTQTMIAFLCTNVSTQFKAMLVKQVTLREVARHVSRLGFLPKCNECMQPHGLEQATAVAVALQTMRSFRDIFAVVCSHIQSSPGCVLFIHSGFTPKGRRRREVSATIFPPPIKMSPASRESDYQPPHMRLHYR